MSRTYRVTVAGRFAGLTTEQKDRLRAEAAEHDMFHAAFTPEGTFIYSDALTRFTVRSLVTSQEPSPADADAEATALAEDAARSLLAARGLGHKDLTSTFICLEDVKVRGSR